MKKYIIAIISTLILYPLFWSGLMMLKLQGWTKTYINNFTYLQFFPLFVSFIIGAIIFILYDSLKVKNAQKILKKNLFKSLIYSLIFAFLLTPVILALLIKFVMYPEIPSQILNWIYNQTVLYLNVDVSDAVSFILALFITFFTTFYCMHNITAISSKSHKKLNGAILSAVISIILPLCVFGVFVLLRVKGFYI